MVIRREHDRHQTPMTCATASNTDTNTHAHGQVI